MSDEAESPLRAVSAAIRDDDLERLQVLLAAHPELIGYSSVTTPSWLCTAAASDSERTANWLIDQGFDVDVVCEKGLSTPLGFAVSNESSNCLALLLRRGANPNGPYVLFRAVRRESPQLAFEYVKLLVQHGADPRRKHKAFGQELDAIQWAELQERLEIRDYLRTACGG